jgi:hypothetical protein
MLFARDLTTRSYPESGTTVAFHASSHHGEDPKRQAVMAQVNRYHVAMLAYLDDKLAKTPDGDGTLLTTRWFSMAPTWGTPTSTVMKTHPMCVVGGGNGTNSRVDVTWLIRPRTRADRESAPEACSTIRHTFPQDGHRAT